jgi:hypothetical protein
VARTSSASNLKGGLLVALGVLVLGLFWCKGSLCWAWFVHSFDYSNSFIHTWTFQFLNRMPTFLNYWWVQYIVLGHFLQKKKKEKHFEFTSFTLPSLRRKD